MGGIKITHKGCKISIPHFKIIETVRNKRRLVAVLPQAEVHPIAPLRRWRGRTRAVCFMVIG